MYRTEKYLKRFLSDAKKLSADLTKANIDHEILLISNETTATEEALLSGLQPSFVIHRVPREPIYASWNRGVKAAQGSFVTFWGVDDTRFAQAIVDGINNLEKEKADYTYFPFRYHRFVQIFGLTLLAKIKTFTPPEFDKKKFMKEMHSGPHFIVRRNIFDQIGYFNESFKIAGDFEFQVRAAKHDLKFTRTLSISGIFRNDGTTLSGSRAAIHKEENERVINASL